MAERFGGIQDISLFKQSPADEGVEVGVRFKVPYLSLGYSKSPDFWASYNGSSGPLPILTKLQALLLQNVPFLNGLLHAAFGGDKVHWLWERTEDSRYFSLECCTPDLLHVSTLGLVEVVPPTQESLPDSTVVVVSV